MIFASLFYFILAIFMHSGWVSGKLFANFSFFYLWAPLKTQWEGSLKEGGAKNNM
jgi:hypothetical protein